MNIGGINGIDGLFGVGKVAQFTHQDWES